MLTLTLNASEKRVQFLLLRGDILLCAQDWLADRGGTELLAPALASACLSLGASPADIGRVACVAGPGGFTGIRLALATAAALARSNGALQAGLEYTRCLAASLPARPGQIVAVLVNARRGWYYDALYAFHRSSPQALSDGEHHALVLPYPLRPVSLRPLPGPAESRPDFPAEADYALGSALSAQRDRFAPLFSERTALLSPAWDHPSPAGLRALTLDLDWEEADSGDIAPLYLRECDAVENLDAMAARQGMDPARAHADLRRLTSTPLQED